MKKNDTFEKYGMRTKEIITGIPEEKEGKFNEEVVMEILDNVEGERCIDKAKTQYLKYEI